MTDPGWLVLLIGSMALGVGLVVYVLMGGKEPQ